MSTHQDELLQSAKTKRLALKLKTTEEPVLYNRKFFFEPDVFTDEHRKKAANELRETPENVEEGLRVLRELLKGEPNLNVPTDTEHLQTFLRPCKWYPESAFGLMKRFYRFRQNQPRYNENLVPSNERTVLVSGMMAPIPTRTLEGSRVFYIQGGKKWKPKEVSLDQIFRGVILYLMAAVVEPSSQVCGVHVVLDMDGLTVTHVTYFTPSFASAVVDFVQRCLPCRLKGIHIVNQPFIFNMVFAFFKPFLHEKFRKRIHFHGTDKNSLLSYIDANALPVELGGSLETCKDQTYEPLFNYMCAFEEEFKETNKYGYTSKA